MLRTIRLLFCFAIALATGMTGLPVVSSAPGLGPVSWSNTAEAQTRKRRRSLLSVLFGRRTPRRKAVVRKRVKRASVRKSKRRRKAVRRKSTRRSGNRQRTRSRLASTRKRRAPVTAPVVVEKREDSRVVLVMGDFFGGALARGLDVSFEKVGGIRVVNKTWPSSGFVRNDIVDWPVRAGELIGEIKPDYVVVLLGTNDRQLLRDGRRKLKKRTPAWDKAYNDRVDRLAATLQQSKVPFTWMGLPPVRFNRMNKDFLEFNTIYRKSATAAGGQFVDVWDGFANASGEYIRSGPDVSGQIVLLRSKDGVNFTRAGRRRLAFYVEDEIQRVLKEGPSPAFAAGIAGLEGENDEPEVEVYDPRKSGRTVVVRLDDPSVDGGSTLAGAEVNLSSQLTSKPEVPVASAPLPTPPSTARAGRVDDYSWPPGQGNIPSAPAAVASSN